MSSVCTIVWVTGFDSAMCLRVDAPHVMVHLHDDEGVYERLLNSVTWRMGSIAHWALSSG
jgi:hypothetical protein